MNSIDLDLHQISYTIRYQKHRKTIQLKILGIDRLEITVPHNLSISNIEKIILGKKAWILKHRYILLNTTKNPINKIIAPGQQILFLGKPRTISFLSKTTPVPSVSIDDNQISFSFSSSSETERLSTAIPLLKHWYINTATKILSDKTLLWSITIGVQYQHLNIKAQKTRWGSCSSKGNVNYNWRIIMAPPEVIDYLVIHELCHLRIPNHSALFWQEVSKFCPNFKDHRNWLRTNGGLLMGIL